MNLTIKGHPLTLTDQPRRELNRDSTKILKDLETEKLVTAKATLEWFKEKYFKCL